TRCPRRSDDTMAMKWIIHFIAIVSSLRLGHLVDRVLRNLDRDRLVLQTRLAGEPRGKLEAPRLVEEIVLLVGRRVEGLVALAHDDMAGRAGAAFLARVLDLDAVVEERIADGGARRHLDLGALGTERLVRQDLETSHRAT